MKTAQLFLFALLALAATKGYADPGSPASTATDTSASSATNYYSAPPATPTKKKKKKKKASPSTQSGVQELTLPMAKGELEAEVDADVAQRERANAPRTRLEFDVSSWQPKQVSMPSNLSNTTNYTTKGIPAMDVDFFAPIGGRQLNLEFGLGFLAMQRTGNFSSSGLSFASTQNGYIATLRAGATYSPWLLLEDKLIPYGEALLLPTLFTSASATPFDSGVSQFGIPVSVGIGTLYQISKPISLDVGLTEVLGSVSGSTYTGFGIHGGVRIQI